MLPDDFLVELLKGFSVELREALPVGLPQEFLGYPGVRSIQITWLMDCPYPRGSFESICCFWCAIGRIQHIRTDANQCHQCESFRVRLLD